MFKSSLIFTCLPRWAAAAKRAMILDPMYGEYRHVLDSVMGMELVPFELHKGENFRIDTDALIANVRALRPDLVALVNPNSPTGQPWSRSAVLRFLDGVPESTRIVIDETYIEYAGEGQSIECEAWQRPNVVVLKSMSKVYALSGMRVGYLVAAPPTVRSLGKWMPPWAVSLPAQVAAVEALADPEYYAERYRQTAILREELASELRRDPSLTVYPSIASFVLLETQSSAQRIVEKMRESDVFVRNCDSMSTRLADRFVRVAVRSRGENHRIADALLEAVR